MSDNYIEFVSIKAVNFLSIGSDPVEVTFKPGLNIIQGINKDKSDRSNGSGKSTLMESIYFALFGKTMKKLNKGDVVNWKNKKGTEVELIFKKDGVEYKIIRRLKPSELLWFVDGEENTRDSVDNTEKDIQEVLGVTEDIVKNCVIMSINKTVPFMAQGKVERRKFIEGIFDLSVFTGMLKLARDEYNQKSKELTIVETKNNEKIKNLDVYKEQSIKFEDIKQEKIGKLKDKCDTGVETINKLKSKLQKVDSDELEKFNPVIEKIDNKINEFELSIRSINNKIIANKSSKGNIEKQIKGTISEGTCPTCLRLITEDDKCDIDSKISEFKNEIKKLDDSNEELRNKQKSIEENIDKLKKKRSEIESKILKIKSIIEENDDINDDIKEQENILRMYKDQIASVKDEINTFDKLIDDITNEVEENTKLINSLNREIDVLDKVKFIVSENGVKSFIVNKMLDIFNTKINFYLKRLNANCKIKFNEFFEETIINDKNQECSYHNFSSGEARNIDISIMLAFMDIQRLQGNFDTNLAAFDELIDGSLDEDGVNYILDILNDIIDNDNKFVYLISHRKEANKYATGDVIRLEKFNGITTRVK